MKSTVFIGILPQGILFCQRVHWGIPRKAYIPSKPPVVAYILTTNYENNFSTSLKNTHFQIPGEEVGNSVQIGEILGF